MNSHLFRCAIWHRGYSFDPLYEHGNAIYLPHPLVSLTVVEDDPQLLDLSTVVGATSASGALIILLVIFAGIQTGGWVVGV